ncbi:phosphatase PAP2 family protein [Petroclostridium sp. X23]|uniref:phosphatase PAP2 family protein n=1 Tax=Petroclostridium sp. X23 TaxID=3045146 RepID=UPI0024AC868A|nr:phosphatase PAP2 family protein [Petroclostridium sp. X23]WHH60282.1 phosphatase PAP2 family protein [Petroclostridium sp. X23]
MSRFIRYIQKEDIRLFFMINEGVKCKLFDKIMPVITHLGSAAVTISFALLIIILSKGSITGPGWEIAASLTASHIIVQIMKKIINRLRPHQVLNDVNTFDIRLYSYSFPSGHTTAAFSIAGSIAFLFPGFTVLALSAAGLVGISRMYLGVHYPTDVLIGTLLGFASAFYVHKLFLFIQVM